MRTKLVLWLCAALVVLLSGCIRHDVNISIEDDGLYKAETITAGPLESGDSAIRDGVEQQFGMSACDVVKRTGNDLIDSKSDDPRFGIRMVSPFLDGDVCGLRTESFFDPSIPPFDDGSAFIGTVFGGPLGDRRLEQVGENWEFETPFGVRELGGADQAWFGQQGLPFRDLDALGEPIDVTIRVDLPGQAISGRHNATSVKGGTFTWEIDYNNPPTRLFAATEPSSSTGVFVVGGAVAAIVLGVGVAAAQLVRSRVSSSRHTSPAVQAAVPANSAMANSAPPEPVFDAENNVWTLHDPMRGKLWYHEASSEWVPFS